MDRIDALVRNLPRQGWTRPEIDKAVSILQEAPAKKSDVVRFLDTALYWLLLFVTIFANFVISIVLVPFLLVLTGFAIYFALFFLGIVFGTMLDVVVRETEYLQQQHYVVAEVLIPAIGLITVYMITRFSNKLAGIMQLPGTHSPWLIAVVYVFAFSLPHIVFYAAHTKLSAMRFPSA